MVVGFHEDRISLFGIPYRSVLMKTAVPAPSIQAIASAESLNLAILRSLELHHERRHARSVFTFTRNIKNPSCVLRSRTLDKDASVNTSVFQSFERPKFGKLSRIYFSNCNQRLSFFARLRSRTFATETGLEVTGIRREIWSTIRSGL